MSSKVVKAALKEAKEHMTKREFQVALKCCKRALNQDPNNVMATLFAAKCYMEDKEWDSAEKAFNRGVVLSPDNVLSWQGLASFLEKSPAHKEELSQRKKLVEPYSKLVELYANDQEQELNKEKLWDTIEKLWELQMALGEFSEAVSTLQRQAVHFAKDKNRLRQAQNTLIRVLNRRQSQEELSETHLDILDAALKAVISDNQSIQNQEHMKIRLSLLQKRQSDAVELMQAAATMLRVFPSSTIALDCTCNVFMRLAAKSLFHVSNTKILPEMHAAMEEFMTAEKFAEARSKKSNVVIVQGMAAKLILDGRLTEARHLLEDVQNSESLFFASALLALCQLEGEKYSAAASNVENALLLLSKEASKLNLSKSEQNKFTLGLKGKLLVCWYFQPSESNLSRALSLVQDLEPFEDADDELRVACAKIYALKGQESEVRSLVSSLQENEARQVVLWLIEGILAMSGDDLVVASEQFNRILQASPNNFEALLYLGQIEFRSEETREKALPLFLKAAKINAGCAVPFLYLGKHYEAQGTAGLDKARKCYQKCFSLDSQCDEAGERLSDIYKKQNLTESNLDFLTSLTRSTNCKRWAFVRLGMLHLQMGDYFKAALNLKCALRSDADDATSWECLADAYTQRGSHAAALKAYERVLELNPGATYPKYQVGAIKLLLGKHVEARKVFLDIQDYVPALKGIGESYISQAKLYLSDNVDKNALDCSTKALDALSKGATKRPDLSCFWKLMGEACVILHPLPSPLFPVHFSVPSALHKSDRAITKATAMRLGTRCYERAAEILGNRSGTDTVALSAAWHDVAFSYLVQHKEENEPERKMALMRKSIAAAKKCVRLDKANPSHWNLLGVIAMSTLNHNEPALGLAQHAFIKTVQLAGGQAEAWTNLGVLYLIKGNSRLANLAFKESQSADPSYINGWVGQAILADQGNYAEEAMDLFRHATFLGNEPEACVSYASWVCRTLEEMAGLSLSDKDDRGISNRQNHKVYCVEKMFGVTIAVDCLTRYTNRHVSDSYALNMLGVLLEKEGLYRSSRQALENALEVVSEQNSADKIRFNLARVCFKLNEYQTAAVHYYSISKTNLASLCGHAVACYKAGNFEDSYTSYSRALEVVESNLDKSQILAAMACIAMKIQGHGAAKTLLFQACQLHPSSIQAIFGLCVLGIQMSDVSLIQAAMQEMGRWEDDSRHVASISSLKALVQGIMMKQHVEAKRTLEKQIRRYPWQPRLWASLANTIVHSSHEGNEAVVARCAEKATRLSRIQHNGSTIPKNQSGDARVEEKNAHYIEAFSLLSLSDSPQPALKASANGVHVRPWDPNAWALLLTAHLLANGEHTKSLRLLEKVKTCVAGKGGEVSEHFNLWINNVEAMIMS